MSHKSTEAVVLKSTDYGESDRMVTFLTKDYGKISGIAKRAKKSIKRFGGSLDIFCEVILYFSEKETSNIALIESCDLIDCRRLIRKDIAKMAYASCLTEIILYMAPEREPQPELYRFFSEALDYYQTGPFKKGTALIVELKLLGLLGYAPNLSTCTSCRTNKALIKKEKVAFSPAKGGIVCGDCLKDEKLQKTVFVSPGTLKLLQRGVEMPLFTLHRLVFSKRSLYEAENIIESFEEYIIERELKSKRFIRQIEGRSKANFPAIDR